MTPTKLSLKPTEVIAVAVRSQMLLEYLTDDTAEHVVSLLSEHGYSIVPSVSTEVGIAHPGVRDDGSIRYTPIGMMFAHEEAARASLPFVRENGWPKAVVVTREVTDWAAATEDDQ